MRIDDWEKTWEVFREELYAPLKEKEMGRVERRVGVLKIGFGWLEDYMGLREGHTIVDVRVLQATEELLVKVVGPDMPVKVPLDELCWFPYPHLPERPESMKGQFVRVQERIKRDEE